MGGAGGVVTHTPYNGCCMCKAQGVGGLGRHLGSVGSKHGGM